MQTETQIEIKIRTQTVWIEDKMLTLMQESITVTTVVIKTETHILLFDFHKDVLLCWCIVQYSIKSYCKSLPSFFLWHHCLWSKVLFCLLFQIVLGCILSEEPCCAFSHCLSCFFTHAEFFLDCCTSPICHSLLWFLLELFVCIHAINSIICCFSNLSIVGLSETLFFISLFFFDHRHWRLIILLWITAKNICIRGFIGIAVPCRLCLFWRFNFWGLRFWLSLGLLLRTYSKEIKKWLFLFLLFFYFSSSWLGLPRRLLYFWRSSFFCSLFQLFFLLFFLFPLFINFFHLLLPQSQLFLRFRLLKWTQAAMSEQELFSLTQDIILMLMFDSFAFGCLINF